MSQEINLFDPSLRPKRDWLGFSSVASAAGIVLAVVAMAAVYASHRAGEAVRQQAELGARLAATQKDLQQLQTVLANRKPNPSLDLEATRLTDTIEHRERILSLARDTANSGQAGVADVMRGFSRQIVDGVWLTGFSVATAGIDIRGRLLDPSLLPVYIRRLNGEPAFRGRRFAALDMQGVAPAATPAATPATPVVAPQATFTSFALHASALPAAAPGAKE